MKIGFFNKFSKLNFLVIKLFFNSSKIARNFGMELDWEIPFSYFIDTNGNTLVTPDEPHTHIRVYSMKIIKREIPNYSVINLN